MNLSVFHQGINESGQLWYAYFDGKTWAPDVQVPNVGLSESPSAVALPGGGISVFHQGINGSGQLWYSYYNGKTWAPDVQVPIGNFSDLPISTLPGGGISGISGSPSAVALPGGGISVFYQVASILFYSYFDGKTWAPIAQLNIPGVREFGIAGSPSAVALPGGGISVFHQGINESGQLWYVYYNGKTWAPDVQVPNVGMSNSPSAVVF